MPLKYLSVLNFLQSDFLEHLNPQSPTQDLFESSWFSGGMSVDNEIKLLYENQGFTRL